MFFPEKIKSIKKNDRVLEIGPGSSPHSRSDVLLERKFDHETEAAAQRGCTSLLTTEKKIVYYEGDQFPFGDREFDYIICSHVLEHIDDVDAFASELTRVGRMGYVEFPTVYYEYLYNFSVHKTLLIERNRVIYWMTKDESGLNKFKDINCFFLETLVKGYNELVNEFKVYLFQGFEWESIIRTERTSDLRLLAYNASEIDISVNTNFRQKYLHMLSKLKKRFAVTK
jgi:SAM-dependent methyltransferase